MKDFGEIEINFKSEIEMSGNYQNILDDLTELLRRDEEYIADGLILRNKVIEAALSMNARLLELLMKSDEIKGHFFVEVSGVLVFDKVKFRDFVSHKNFLPDSYTAFRNKIGLVDEHGNQLSQSHNVVLTWPYKDCVLEGGMTKEDHSRNEVFWNTILSPDEITRLFEPKVLTGCERWSVASMKNGVISQPVAQISESDNLLIKGNNLLALHSLKSRYAGKVKVIYIDPPYNTGNDGFKYNDSFNHSTYLTFMRNRLEVAKIMLSAEGFIFIHCDRNEFAYLKVLMDEIMNDGKFVECIVVVNNPAGRDYGGIANMHEYILCYSRSQKYTLNWLDDPEKHFPYSDRIGGFELRELRNRNTTFHEGNRPNLVYPFYVDPKNFDENGLHQISLQKKDEWVRVMPAKSQGIQTVWRWGRAKSEQNINTNIVARPKKNGQFRIFEKYRKTSKMIRSMWGDKYVNSERGTLQVKALVGKQAFTYPKPEETLNRIIEIASDPGDLVMDFFAGSGTTAAVAHKMGRQWIAIEQMSYVRKLTKIRLKKVVEGEQGGISMQVGWKGGGSFVYAELASSNSSFSDQIAHAKNFIELISIKEKMQNTGFLRYNVELDSFDIGEFENLSLNDAKCVLMDCLDVNHLYVNLNSIGDEKFDISDEDADLTRAFYAIPE